MAVYVDSLMPTAKKFCGGNSACHMATDGPIEELHAFARKIGMRQSWFQDHRRVPHYDLTPARRAEAVKLGAKEVKTMDIITMCGIKIKKEDER